MVKIITKIINIILCIIFPISAYMALFSPMMFDAPGSTEDIFVWFLFISLSTFPLVILISIVTSFKMLKSEEGNKKALGFSLLPCINIILFFLIIWLSKGKSP